MSRIKSGWQTAGLLTLVAAGIAVPAWASSGGSESVQRADDPGRLERGWVEQATAGAEARDALPLPPPVRREDLDRALQCMADRGFGMGTATQSGGVFISRSEAKTSEFRDAGKECDLPPPPTDAQIRKMACGTDRARRDRND